MDLVVLAAGMGSRFGGLKQIQPIDEDENFIIDYSIYDAVKAGFDRVIFIIKEENFDIFKSTIGNRLSKIVSVEYAFQKLDNVPKGVKIPETRIKPWGTAHAIYCVKDIVSERFAIINADDFYGFKSFKIVADFLKTNTENEFVSAGYYVKNTLSDKGAVKRGIFQVDQKIVKALVESEVENRAGKIMATPLNQNLWKEISPDTLVSMNMIGFTKKIMVRLEKDFKEFFAKGNLEKEEFLIPMVVNDMIAEGEVKMVVETTPEKWYGITYKEDLEDFKSAIERMKENGVYPKHLYKEKQP
ncbi:MAG: nucleotidyltransferase [Clostridiales bacterium]|nr:nucleotidyltransferase [Clostridiales bacterium]